MPDALALWSVTSARQVIEIDFGDAPRRSSNQNTIRVKNLSVTLTAFDVKVTAEGDDFDSLYLSLDGQSFTGEVSLGDLPAGAISAAVTLRRVTDAAAAVGAKTSNLRASAVAWATPITA